MRPDGRKRDELRPVQITRSYLKHPEGSVLMEMGDTVVICTATVEERVPPFLKGNGMGWVTAEYAMLPRSTGVRVMRESRGRVNARNLEIQRLIGRALRSVVDTAALGERTILLDCDVIQADGGTRTAAITGSFVALFEALLLLKEQGVCKYIPLRDYLAAVSVGLIDDQPLLDLSFTEDSAAAVDMNVVITGSGELVEIQGTAEHGTFTRDQLDHLLDLANLGVEILVKKQQEALGEAARHLASGVPPFEPIIGKAIE
ncbi:MAG: ribonuclease PH [Bacillota bacterium]